MWLVILSVAGATAQPRAEDAVNGHRTDGTPMNRGQVRIRRKGRPSAGVFSFYIGFTRSPCGLDYDQYPCEGQRRQPDPTWVVVVDPHDREIVPSGPDIGATLTWLGRARRGPDGAWWIGGERVVVRLDGVRMDDRGDRMSLSPTRGAERTSRLGPPDPTAPGAW